MDIRELVLKAIEDKKAYDIYELLVGLAHRLESDPGDAVEITEENERSLSMTYDHLRWIAIQYGDKRVYDKVDYPSEDYFNQWLDYGCPGLSKIELQQMLKSI